MILNFKTKFPWGDFTWFVILIVNWKKNYSLQYTTYYDTKTGKEQIIEVAGQKLHSIREDKNNRWKIGMKIHFTTGARTKNYHCFGESRVESTQRIEIKEMIMVSSDRCYVFSEEVKFKNRIETFSKIFKVAIDGNTLTTTEIDLLAKNDGFKNTHDFFRWFNKDFNGKIIHWTDLKY